LIVLNSPCGVLKILMAKICGMKIRKVTSEVTNDNRCRFFNFKVQRIFRRVLIILLRVLIVLLRVLDSSRSVLPIKKS